MLVGVNPSGAPSRTPPGALDTLAVESLRRGNPLRLRARGGSMLPFLIDGDVLVVRPAAIAEIRIGDVICYEPPSGGLCLHRVIGREERGFVTRGDALAYAEIVPDAALLGVVAARERGGRRIVLDTPRARRRGRVVAAVAPVLARLLALARGLRRAGRAALRG
jgi:signal peptidase I